MNRRVEKNFPEVIELVEIEFESKIKDKGIPPEYKGYVATFGTMVVQRGLLPALAYFEKKESKEKEERKKIVNIIKRFLKRKKIINNDKSNLGQYLFLEVRNGKLSKDELRVIENKIIDISIAIKLALRTFPEGQGEV